MSSSQATVHIVIDDSSSPTDVFACFSPNMLECIRQHNVASAVTPCHGAELRSVMADVANSIAESPVHWYHVQWHQDINNVIGMDQVSQAFLAALARMESSSYTHETVCESELLDHLEDVVEEMLPLADEVNQKRDTLHGR